MRPPPGLAPAGAAALPGACAGPMRRRDTHVLVPADAVDLLADELGRRLGSASETVQPAGDQGFPELRFTMTRGGRSCEFVVSGAAVAGVVIGLYRPSRRRSLISRIDAGLSDSAAGILADAQLRAERAPGERRFVL